MEAPPESMSAVGQIERPAAEADEELIGLRARLRALEAELAETHRRTNAAISEAQDRIYWLDRWHVDLNELMTRHSWMAARLVVRALRRLRRG